MTDSLSLLLFFLLSLLIAASVLLLAVAIVFNFRAGLKYRERLAGEIERLRLGRMLVALGIDVDEYVSTVRGVEIHDQMERCNACRNTRECDDSLAEGSVRSDAIGFCNNEETLQQAAPPPN